MSQPPKYTAIIFDLVDTLFNVSFKSRTSIPSSTLRRITLGSNAWFNYEKGLFSENECYSRIAAEFDLDKNELRRAFDEARDSLHANDKLFTLIRELKAESNGQLRVFAMSNISARDYEVLREKPADWSVFDQIFTSSDVGERKPNLGFYRHVLKAADVDPERVIFVDDQFENVFSARSLGMHGIICKTPRRSNATSAIFLEILSSEVASFSSEMPDTLIALPSRQTSMLAWRLRRTGRSS
jgi:FMN phosphatase YigB (HAD superfamily)